MVKRKRTLSAKDNGDNSNHKSASDVGETKRLKASDHPLPLKVEKQENGIGSAKPSPTLVKLPVPSTTSASSCVTTAPVTSESVLGVPLPIPPPAVAQAKPILQLRTSARVLNKQKREESKADLANLLAASNKKAESNVKSEVGEDEEANTGNEEKGKKRRRAWELWSTDDKNIFFESINECGKDFEAIQNYWASKRKKGVTPGFQIKNKDQVRHFYYRTWHKISKHITFSEGVKKATQELYGLINYGELRKKVGGTLDERKGQKLQELIRKGSTSVRVKGKSVRVRTPICRALKKLNKIEEHKEQSEVRVPQSIVVELVPRSVEAWCRVQGFAHNPRVRMTTVLQKPLASVLAHLQEKWRNSNLKLRDTLAARANFSPEIEQVDEPTLRLLPPKACVIKPLNVQPDLMMKSSAVSLQSHEERLKRLGENDSKTDKRKETKSAAKSASSGGEDISNKENEESGKVSKDQESEEDKMLNPEKKNDIHCDKSCSNVGKNCDTEGIGGDFDDFAGEASQEELEDGSEGEPDCLNSPDGDIGGAEVISSIEHLSLPVYVKEEPLECLSPPTSILDPLDLNDQDDMIEPDARIKEEGESSHTLMKLLALETVANSQNVQDDAEVVCIGESTRLTAHVGESNKGPSAAASQNEIQLEERALAGTPEPEEEEKDADTEDKPSTVDIDSFIEKILEGWTLSSAGRITVGELYLMFGQNKKVSLEYEFMNSTHKESEMKCSPAKGPPSSESLETSPSRVNSIGSVGQIVSGLSTPTLASVTSPKASNNVNLEKTPSPVREEKTRAVNEKPAVDKGAAIENLSGMLTQLLSMARVILAKPQPESCSCGHICGRGGGGVRSPAAGRGQGLCGVGRSPGNTKSPRNCRITSLGAHSPGGIRSPLSQTASRSPLAGKPAKERSKPSSAKKLIPDQYDLATPLVEGTSSTNQNIQTPSSQMVVSKQEQSMTVPVTSIGSLSGTTLSGVKVVVGAGGSGGEFKLPTAPAPRQIQSQQANFNAQLTKLLPRYNNRPGRRVMRKSVVVQRQLPLVPRANLQTSNFITMKVLPQINQKFALGTNGIKGFIPLSKVGVSPTTQVIGNAQVINTPIAPATKVQTPTQITNPINANILPMPNQVSMIPQMIQPSMPIVTTCLPTANAISVNVSGQPLLTVEMPKPVTQPQKETVNINNNPPEIINTIKIPDIADLMKPAPLLGDNSNPVATSSPKKEVSRGSDELDVLTTPIKVDQFLNTSTALPKSFTNVLSGESKVPFSSSSVTNAAIRCTNISSLLSSTVSETLSDFPDLSTPPGTPQPFSSTKSSREATNLFSHLENLNSTSSAMSGYPSIPSPSLFNSSLSLDSLPSLNSDLLNVNTQLVNAIPSCSTALPSLETDVLNVNTQLVNVLSSSTSSSIQLSQVPPQNLSPTTSLQLSIIPQQSLSPTTSLLSQIPPQNLSPTPSITSLISSSTPLSLGSQLLTTIATSNLELSPPPVQTNTFTSLLNTPTIHSPPNKPSNSACITSPTSLSSFLHSPASAISKNLSSLLDTLPPSSSSTSSVPELHIPEGSLNLPMLDISIGGTVTLADQTTVLKNEIVSKETNLSSNSVKDSSSSPVRSSTPTSSITIEHRVQETSSEKLLDITLGISNSDSSFSSLLASATQPPRVLDSSILGALNMDSLDCGAEAMSRGTSGTILEGISSVGISGFPSLDTSTPSPPPSPSRLLQQGDNQWLNNEVNDFSLSSLLGHLESPVKGTNSRGPSQSTSETSMPSLVAVYNENSLDFTAKFAEMKAAQASQLFKN